MNKNIILAEEFLEKQEYEKAFHYYSKASLSNEPLAFTGLGIFYYQGIGVEKDIEKAMDFFHKASLYNEPKALTMLGDFSFAENKIKEAIDYYSRASILGVGHAYGMLGIIEYNGLDGKVNYEEAIEYFEIGTEYNDVNSFYYLGECYLNGYGIEKDEKKAFDSFLCAVSIYRGNENMILSLAECYYLGKGVDVNFEKAYELFEEISEKSDKAKYYLARMYYFGEYVSTNYNEAFKYLEDLKDNESLVLKGIMYTNGQGVEKDEEKAYLSFYGPAYNGNSEAQLLLGDCYLYGKGIKKDYSQAIILYKKASKDNKSNANISLGYCYYVIKEYEKAITYYEKEENEYGFCGLGNCFYKLKKYDSAFSNYLKASELDNASAMIMLSKLYKKGNGCEKSNLSSLFWKQRYLLKITNEKK